MLESPQFPYKVGVLEVRLLEDREVLQAVEGSGLRILRTGGFHQALDCLVTMFTT